MKHLPIHVTQIQHKQELATALLVLHQQEMVQAVQEAIQIQPHLQLLDRIL